MRQPKRWKVLVLEVTTANSTSFPESNDFVKRLSDGHLFGGEIIFVSVQRALHVSDRMKSRSNAEMGS